MATPTPAKAPASPVMSGARNRRPHASRRAPSEVQLDDLSAARGSVPPPSSIPVHTMASTRVEQTKRGGLSNFLLAVLVLIAAGGAAAVVYFALPYLT